MTENGISDGYVLVVDDDSNARLLHSNIVSVLGFSARAAEDGVEALAHVNQELPSIILLDLMMPGMDGFEVLFRLQANPRTRNIPIVIVSAHTHAQQGLLSLPGVKRVIPKGMEAMAQIEAALADLTGRLV